MGPPLGVEDVDGAREAPPGPGVPVGARLADRARILSELREGSREEQLRPHTAMNLSGLQGKPGGPGARHRQLSAEAPTVPLESPSQTRALSRISSARCNSQTSLFKHGIVVTVAGLGGPIGTEWKVGPVCRGIRPTFVPGVLGAQALPVSCAPAVETPLSSQGGDRLGSPHGGRPEEVCAEQSLVALRLECRLAGAGRDTRRLPQAGTLGLPVTSRHTQFPCAPWCSVHWAPAPYTEQESLGSGEEGSRAGAHCLLAGLEAAPEP